MDHVIYFIEALPWQLAVIVLGVTQAIIGWVVYRRRVAFPAAMVSDMISDFKAAEEMGQDHATDLVAVTGRLDSLERDRDEEKIRLDGFVKVNAAEHAFIIQKLGQIAEGVAEIQGWRSGRKNGPRA